MVKRGQTSLSFIDKKQTLYKLHILPLSQATSKQVYLDLTLTSKILSFANKLQPYYNICPIEYLLSFYLLIYMQIRKALQLLNTTHDRLFEIINGTHKEQLETTQIQHHFKRMLRIAFLTLLKDTGNFKSDKQTQARVLLNTLLVFFTEIRFHLEREVVKKAFQEMLAGQWSGISMQAKKEDTKEEDWQIHELLKCVLSSATKECFSWKQPSFTSVTTLSILELSIVIEQIKRRLKRSFRKRRRSREMKNTYQAANPIDGIGD